MDPIARIDPTAHPDPASPATTATTVEIIPVTGLPEVRTGTDLAALLATALGPEGPTPLRDGDVLCVSSKIVSKARGLVVDPTSKAQHLEAATVRRVARRRHGSVVTSIVETVSGPVLAAAGIDASNSPDGILLLPPDPDAEAAALHAALGGALGVQLGIVLTDTSSRIWRVGVGDIALGAAGVRVLQDLRGELDDTGRQLGITVRDLADELAAAADLAKGKATRSPAAIVRGVPGALVGSAAPPRHAAPSGHTDPADVADPGARALNRTGPSDWFRRPSLESVWQALGVAAEDEPVAAMDVEDDEVRIARALEIATAVPTSAHARRGPDDAITVTPTGTSPAAWAAAGALAERIRTALRAEEIAAPLTPCSPTVQLTEPGGPRR